MHNVAACTHIESLIEKRDDKKGVLGMQMANISRQTSEVTLLGINVPVASTEPTAAI